MSVRDLVWSGPGASVAITRARGGLIGRCDQCVFVFEDLAPNAGGAVIVAGAERARDVDNDGERELFAGRDVRWKIIGGRFRLVIRQARDVDLSVVGSANVRLRGTEGKYSVNGEAPLPVPPEFALFELGSTPVVAP